MFLIIVTLQNNNGMQEVQAEEIGIGRVIFEDNEIPSVRGTLLINELSYTIIKLHLALAGQVNEINNYEWETLTTIRRLEELSKIDIIGLLDMSENKEEALAEYLSESNKQLQKGETIAMYTKQDMEILKRDMQSCVIEKNVSDKVYFDAINRYDQNIMEIALIDSINYENCVAENRIQYNAKIGIMNKLVFYLGLLQKKYDILFDKQEIITKNFIIFKNSMLDELNQVDALIKQYSL